MKLFKLIMLFVVAAFTFAGASAQSNATINMLTLNSGTVGINGTGTLLVTIGNTGPSTAIANGKINATISAQPLVTFAPTASQSLPAGWTIVNNLGSSLILCNSSTTIPVGTAANINIALVGGATAGSGIISGSLSYRTNCTAPGSLAGNSTADDVASAGFIVAAASSTLTTTGALTPFTTCAGTASSEQSFTVSGTALTANVVATAPTGFEVSTTSGSGFASTASITPTSGSVTNVPVYVRVAASATAGSPSGNVNVSSTGATAVDVAVSATVNAALPAPIVTVVNNCNGTSTLSTTSTGTLLWSNGATTASIIVSTAGTFTVTATAAGCASPAGSGIAAPGSTPATPVVIVVDNCNGTSTLSTTATGTLLWSNGATTASITVTTAGAYTVTQTVGNCVSLAGSGTAAPKTTPATPVVTVVDNCNNTSTLSTTSTGSLLWSNGATTASITATAAGTFTVVATVNGCASLSGSGIAAPKTTPATPVVTVVNSCNGQSTLTTTATGALLWSNGSTTASITVASLPVATYTVVNTVNGCPSIAGSGVTAAATGCTVINIADPAVGQMEFTTLANASQSANTLMFAPSYKLNIPFYNLSQDNIIPNGTIAVKINLGTKLNIDPAFVLASAPLSTYFAWTSATVLDSVIITGTQIANIPEDFASTLVFNVKGKSSCAANVRTRIMITNLLANLSDEDLQNNVATLQYSLPVTVTTTHTNVTCNGLNNGIINVVSSPGTTIVVKNAANLTVGTTSPVTGLAPGVYTVTATALSEVGLGITCTNNASSTIVQPAAALSVTTTNTVNNICTGANIGSVTVTSAGGTAPYSYTIAGPTVNTTGASNGIFTSLLAGSYTITSTDANGCTATTTASVTQPTSTAPDISLGSDITGSLFASNGTTQTIVYNVTEIAGNQAVGDTIRITKVAGFDITFNPSIASTTVGSTNYILDNTNWKIDNSNALFVSIILKNPTNTANPGILLCNTQVRVAVTVTRNTTNISTFTLSARLRRANGEINLSNNLNSIVLAAE